MAAPMVLAAAKGLIALAPSIAGWFGGKKAEIVAEEVVSIAQEVTGIPDPTKATNHLINNPDLHHKFLMQLEQNRVRIEEAYLKDRQHARELHKDSQMPSLIAIALSAMVALMGWGLFEKLIPEANMTLANILFGAVVAKWSDSIAYWVGNSRDTAVRWKNGR